VLAGAAVVGSVAVGIGPASAASALSAAAPRTFLGGLHQVQTIASTVPSSPMPRPGDGDVNPYGVAVVDTSIGHLVAGDVLVSNFNNAANLQGTGRTIVEVSPSGSVRTFARLPELRGGTGLTTALAILPFGYVIVGSLPTKDGTSATATRGALLLLNAEGRLVETVSGGDINGPWDLTAVAFGPFAEVFVTNVLNGTVAASPNTVDKGSVVRLILDLSGSTPTVLANTVIASGFAERTDPAALVVGPTGVGLGRDGTLYVADTAGNAIRAIPGAMFRFTDAGTGMLVSPQPGQKSLLNSPLGLTIAPNGDILTVNGGNGRIVETTPDGVRVASRFLDTSGSPPGAGALFGLAVTPGASGLYFVDDATNQLDLLAP
jgi:sugar lactone lactonase YvrE